MPSYTVLSVEKLREKDTQWGKKKVLKLRLRNAEGTEKDAEWFTSVKTPDPAEGSSIEGEVTQGDYGLEFKKPKGNSGGGGFKRSPAETKAIQRQHSQHMMLLHEANLVAAGRQPFSGEEMRKVTNFFERDIAAKDRAIEWDGLTSDVPADTSDLVGG